MAKSENVSGKVLTDLLAQNKMLMEKLAELEAKGHRKQTVTCKVSEKGALSVYGIGRFPVTLYRQQWEALLAHSDAIKAFIKANDSKLSVKE